MKDLNKLLAASLRFKPVGTPSAELKESGETRELVETWNTGHPGVKVSLAQAGDVRTVYGMSDMSQLRDAYDEADMASLIANSNVRVFKPE